VSATTVGAITFSDIAGFTRFTREAGDAAALALLDAFEEIVQTSLPAEGRIVKMLGDGVFTFVPDPCAALRAAARQQARFAELADPDRPLWVRTGVHFGTPIERKGDLFGHDVNLASRVADQALPGEVLATAAVVQAAGDATGLTIDEVGPVYVKGVDDAVRLYRVEGAIAPVSGR
jgi:adenylate cyclase